MKQVKKRVVVMGITACLAPIAISQTETSFINKLVNQDHFKRSYVVDVLKKAKQSTTVIHKINHPAESKDWDWYQHFFIKPDRIKLGLQYWKTHQQALTRAEKKYGIPPSIIVAILGVETLYGKRQGSFPTINALYTLAFHHKNRTNLFQHELEQFFILCRQMHWSISKIKGSYAGALGIPQFMPSTYLNTAISASNQKPNLFTQHDDAILSVAHFLSQHQWQRNEPIIAQTLLTNSPKASWQTTQPTHHVAWYQKQGIKLKSHLSPQSEATIIKMKTKNHHPYWLAATNFYSILSYNSSKNYGIAVYTLSQKIKGLHDANRRI